MLHPGLMAGCFPTFVSQINVRGLAVGAGVGFDALPGEVRDVYIPRMLVAVYVPNVVVVYDPWYGNIAMYTIYSV